MHLTTSVLPFHRAFHHSLKVMFLHSRKPSAQRSTRRKTYLLGRRISRAQMNHFQVEGTVRTEVTILTLRDPLQSRVVLPLLPLFRKLLVSMILPEPFLLT